MCVYATSADGTAAALLCGAVPLLHSRQAACHHVKAVYCWCRHKAGGPGSLCLWGK